MNEEQIIISVKNGKREAFSELVVMHQAMIRGYIARFIMDSDAVFDLAQETFLAAYSRFQIFDESRDLGTWLRGIAKTTALEYLRKNIRRKKRETERVDPILQRCSKRLADDNVETGDKLDRLKDCMKQLDGKSAELVGMRYYHHLSIQDIAEKKKKKQGAIRMILLRIRETLRKCIENASVANNAIL
jgi:RNA polymerase sigma-70 factor (ECF subfamily)